jgi:hypothetical protein
MVGGSWGRAAARVRAGAGGGAPGLPRRVPAYSAGGRRALSQQAGGAAGGSRQPAGGGRRGPRGRGSRGGSGEWER